jgi:hypothetical protein
MTQQQLIEEWEYWISSNADWEQFQAYARSTDILKGTEVDIVREAIADNDATIELLEEIIRDRP